MNQTKASRMQPTRLAAGQFEPAPADKDANFQTIATLTARAAEAGAQIVCFQEQSLVGYGLWNRGQAHQKPTVVEPDRLAPAWRVPGIDPFSLAEPVPEGPSTAGLIELARKHGLVVMAGLPELTRDNAVANTYLIVSPEGFVGKYRKSHCVPGLEYSYFKQGQRLDVFDLPTCRAGVLICYDNHFPEAHRVLALRGAHLIVMPHVTVSRSWWPDADLRQARQQARCWILTWLRARAFDNSVYVAFVNQGSESGQASLGCTMILNPEGHIVAETQTTGQDLVVADLDPELLYRVRRRTHDYLVHRRPELYTDLVRHDLV